MKLNTLLGLCNWVANSSMRWLEPTNPMPQKSRISAKKLKLQQSPFTNGAEEFTKIVKKCRLDDADFKYVPAAKTDIRVSIRKELRRLEEQKNEMAA